MEHCIHKHIFDYSNISYTEYSNAILRRIPALITTTTTTTTTIQQ